MEKRKLGRTDMKVGVMGFGGSEIGLEKSDFKTVERILNNALDHGLNVIDTAECYENSEQLIGETVSHRRSEYYVFTKCGHANGLPYEDFDPKLIRPSIIRSLKRLNTEYIDLVNLHGAPEEVLKMGSVVEELFKLKEEGKVRYIGYSGDGLDALYALRLDCFDVLQTSINIADQEAIDLLLPEASQRNIGVMAKRPLANVAWINAEKLKAQFDRKYNMAKRMNKHTNLVQPTKLTYWERLKKLNYRFLNEDTETVNEYALGFTLAVPGVHMAIVGTTQPNRWNQNLNYLKNPLGLESYNYIRKRWNEISDDWEGKS